MVVSPLIGRQPFCCLYCNSPNSHSTCSSSPGCCNPTSALMQDQVAGLQAKGVPSEHLSSSQTQAERQRVLTDLTSASPTIKLLFVTPELIATPR